MIRDNPKKFRLRRYFLANRFKKLNSDPVVVVFFIKKSLFVSSQVFPNIQSLIRNKIAIFVNDALCRFQEFFVQW